MNPPEWAVNNDLLRQVLLRSFPRMWTNETQLRRALLWMEIIYLFFRRGLPAKAVAMRLFNNDYAEEKRPWLASANPEKYIEDTVRRIRRTATGLRSTGKPRSNTKGRPKKAAPVKSATK